LADWDSIDRPKLYGEIRSKTEYRFSNDDLSKMSLPQLIAAEHRQKELSLKEALEIIRLRKEKQKQCQS
jgi:hypothetical protein